MFEDCAPRIAAGAGVGLRALQTLLDALAYARDARVDPWELAVELETLLEQGLSLTDVRWLVLRGYAEHALEITPARADRRMFQPLSITEFPSRTSLVLTADGAAAVSGIEARIQAFSRATQQGLPACKPGWRPLQLTGSLSIQHPPRNQPANSPGTPRVPDEFNATAGLAPASHLHEPEPTVSTEIPRMRVDQGAAPLVLKPQWDANCRELRFAGQVIKRFRVPAENQELVLNVFEEEGWPKAIDDPLPPHAAVDPMRRLQATIRSLNRNRTAPTLHFFGNGCGHSVCWEAQF